MSRRIIIDETNNIINSTSFIGSDRTEISNISSGVTQGDIIQAFKGIFQNELNTGDIILIRNSITVVDTQTELDILAPNIKLVGNITLDSNQQNSTTSILTNKLEINDPLVYFSKRIANGDVGLIFQYFNNTAGNSAQVGFIGFNAKDKKFRLYESTNRDIATITNDKVYLSREQFMDNVGGIFNPINNEITYDFLGDLQVKSVEAKTGYFHDGINVNNFSVGGDQFKINSIGAIDTSGNINVNNNILLDALTGNLIVGGNIDLTGNLNINNGKYIVFARTGNTKINGNLDLSGNLVVGDRKMIVYSSSGNTVINGYLDLSGNFTIGNKKMVVNSTTGNTGIAGQLDLSKNLVVNVDKFVVEHSTGDTGIAGQLDLSKNLVVNVDKFIVDHLTGDTGIAGQLDLSKNLVVNVDKFVVDYLTGDTGIAGQLDLSKNLVVNVDKFIVDYLTGDTGIAGQLDLSKNLVVNIDKFVVDYLTGDTGIAGQLDLSKNLVVNVDKFVVDYLTGDTRIAGQLDLSKNLVVNVDKFVVDYLTGDTEIAGQLDLSKNFVVNTDKFVVYHDTGNVHVAGTIDISQNLIINNNAFKVDSNGNTDISSNCYIGGSLTIVGAVIQKSDLSIIGNLYVEGNTNLQGDVNINDQIFFDTSGNVNIHGQLDLSKNLVVNVDKFVVDHLTGDTGIAGQLDLSKNLVVDGDKFFVDVSNSKVGINISSPIYELDVSGSIATQCAIIYDDNEYNGVFAHRNNRNNTDYALLQTSLGRTRINCKKGSGNIIFTHGDGMIKQEFDLEGNVIIQGNLFSYSDARIKTNIDTIENALDKVIALRGVTYNMIKDIKENPNTARRHLGLIAQEVEAVIPEAVKEEKGIKTVAYGNIVGLIIQSIKELKDKFDLFNKNNFDNIKLLKFLYLYHKFSFWKQNIKNNIYHIGSYIGIGTKEPISPLHVEGNITQTGESKSNLKTTIIDGSLRINFNTIKQKYDDIKINLNDNSNFIIDISNNSNILINDIDINSIGQIGEIYILKKNNNNCSITFDSKLKFIINTKPILINNYISCIKYTILKTNLITCRFEIFD